MVPGRVSRSRICFSRFIVTGRVSPFLLVPGSVSSVSWLRTCFSCLMVPGRVSTVSLLQDVFFLSYGSRMCFSCLMVPGCVSPVSWFQDVFLLSHGSRTYFSWLHIPARYFAGDLKFTMCLLKCEHTKNHLIQFSSSDWNPSYYTWRHSLV